MEESTPNTPNIPDDPNPPKAPPGRRAAKKAPVGFIAGLCAAALVAAAPG